jgi:amyloid beta precursor protein binding protein 1
MERSHVPFVVILLRKLQQWMQDHDGELPKPSVDRKAFTDSINAFRQTENSDDENVDEALGALGQHVWRPVSAGTEGVVPKDIRALFQDKACENVTSKVRIS